MPLVSYDDDVDDTHMLVLPTPNVSTIPLFLTHDYSLLGMWVPSLELFIE